ncbi:Tetratricopeptide repeat protein [Bremerella volcania]|uniref:Tetratricopeptide repeat protein n=1 Tax=Bremerella volcania TaxID=2527984 RepID=A0A518CFW8_9BACT|nr:tetratricopeptide repeat protein [Bremerella volcania]QDU78132.1 Tetratricopeptide repeat protein [Bremerella volcania]
MKTIPFITIFLLMLTSAAWAQSALEDDRRMMQGLLDRQLFGLAERYAAQQVIAEGITSSHRAEMAAELVRAYSLHALNARPSERERYWNSAAAVLPQFQKQFPDPAASILIEVQTAHSQLAQLRLLRQEGEVFGDNAKLNQAQKLSAQLLGQYEALQEKVDGLLRESHSPNNRLPLTSDQLLALSRKVALQSAEATEQQGLSYPPDSLDRTNAMVQVLQQVEPLTKLRPDTQVKWPAQLLAIRALRHLGRLDQARSTVAMLRRMDPPPPVSVLSAAWAEDIRVALAQNDLPLATQMINQARGTDGMASAELDYAIFETYLSFWKQAEEKQNTPDIQLWQGRSAAVVRELEQLYGPYWARRAEQQLTGSASTGGTQNVDLLRRTAENYVRQKDWDEAIKNYDLGAQAARASNQPSEEYQLRLAAAAVAVEAGNLAEGVKRLRGAALEFPAEQDASLRHLTAAYYQSQIARQSDPPQLEPYIALLRENLSRWNEGEPAAQAAMWLAQIEFSRGNWRAATEAYLLIPPKSTHFPLAVEGVRQASLKWFQTAGAKQELVPQDVRKVIDYFEQVVLNGQSGGGEWTATMRLASESAAQLWLNYTDHGYDNARAVIEVALRSNPNGPDGWRSRLESLQVIALAGLGKLDQAQAKLQQVRDDSPHQLFEVLQALGQMGGSASPAIRQQIAQIELTVIAMLRPNMMQLDEQTRMVIATREAEALAASGKLDQAIELYATLAQQLPNDSEIQVGLARMLSRGTTAEQQEQALDRWRQISRKSRTQSPTWYEAKLEIARCHIQLGNPEEAKQIVRYLQTLYPDMGGPEMKARFVELMQGLPRN